MAMLFMMALGSALMLSTTTETRIASNFRNSSEALYAADAGLERSVDDLLTIPDWNAMLSGTATSAFIDGAPGDRVLADGSTLNVNQVLAYANCQKTVMLDGGLPRSHARASVGREQSAMAVVRLRPARRHDPTSSVDSPFYVVVMVGDDPSENDGDPLKDGSVATNPGSGVMALRAEAFGPRGVRKTVELTIARADTTELERGYTGQHGQDEPNGRAGNAAVQTLGKSLSNQSPTSGIGRAGVRILSWREVR